MNIYIIVRPSQTPSHFVTFTQYIREKKQSNVKSIIVYSNKENMGTVKSLYDSIIMPTEAKNADYKRAIPIRNEWMVDRSARVIAVYNGEAGGTRNTIAYAAKKNVTVRQIDV